MKGVNGMSCFCVGTKHLQASSSYILRTNKFTCASRLQTVCMSSCHPHCSSCFGLTSTMNSTMKSQFKSDSKNVRWYDHSYWSKASMAVLLSFMLFKCLLSSFKATFLFFLTTKWLQSSILQPKLVYQHVIFSSKQWFFATGNASGESHGSHHQIAVGLNLWYPKESIWKICGAWRWTRDPETNGLTT